MTESGIRGGLLGLSVGDALGVPYVDSQRGALRKQPAGDMLGYGKHFQPPGTWSDDSSLAFCTTESLHHGIDMADMADRYCEFYYDGYWAPRKVVFKVCKETGEAINRLRGGVGPEDSGNREENKNCNGSLKRILPLAFLLRNADRDERFSVIHAVSSITHAQICSQMACGLYADMAVRLLRRGDPAAAYTAMQEEGLEYYSRSPFSYELPSFSRILNGDVSSCPESEIHTDSFVVHTLEACLWCLLNYSSYVETVLAAVNLGGDTDTTASVVGGLAGIYYGDSTIPEEWVDLLARKEDILELSLSFKENLMIH